MNRIKQNNHWSIRPIWIHISTNFLLIKAIASIGNTFVCVRKVVPENRRTQLWRAVLPTQTDTEVKLQTTIILWRMLIFPWNLKIEKYMENSFLKRREHSLWRRANAQNVSFWNLYGGQFTSSAQLIILNYRVTLFHWRSNTVSLQNYPPYSSDFK